jgi:hypothetical protein
MQLHQILVSAAALPTLTIARGVLKQALKSSFTNLKSIVSLRTENLAASEKTGPIHLQQPGIGNSDVMWSASSTPAAQTERSLSFGQMNLSEHGCMDGDRAR